jgi:hypothetical protein
MGRLAHHRTRSGALEGPVLIGQPDDTGLWHLAAVQQAVECFRFRRLYSNVGLRGSRGRSHWTLQRSGDAGQAGQRSGRALQYAWSSRVRKRAL